MEEAKVDGTSHRKENRYNLDDPENYSDGRSFKLCKAKSSKHIKFSLKDDSAYDNPSLLINQELECIAHSTVRHECDHAESVQKSPPEKRGDRRESDKAAIRLSNSSNIILNGSKSSGFMTKLDADGEYFHVNTKWKRKTSMVLRESREFRDEDENGGMAPPPPLKLTSMNIIHSSDDESDLPPPKAKVSETPNGADPTMSLVAKGKSDVEVDSAVIVGASVSEKARMSMEENPTTKENEVIGEISKIAENEQTEPKIIMEETVFQKEEATKLENAMPVLESSNSINENPSNGKVIKEGGDISTEEKDTNVKVIQESINDMKAEEEECSNNSAEIEEIASKENNSIIAERKETLTEDHVLAKNEAIIDNLDGAEIQMKAELDPIKESHIEEVQPASKDIGSQIQEEESNSNAEIVEIAPKEDSIDITEKKEMPIENRALTKEDVIDEHLINDEIQLKAEPNPVQEVHEESVQPISKDIGSHRNDKDELIEIEHQNQEKHEPEDEKEQNGKDEPQENEMNSAERNTIETETRNEQSLNAASNGNAEKNAVQSEMQPQLIPNDCEKDDHSASISSNSIAKSEITDEKQTEKTISTIKEEQIKEAAEKKCDFITPCVPQKTEPIPNPANDEERSTKQHQKKHSKSKAKHSEDVNEGNEVARSMQAEKSNVKTDKYEKVQAKKEMPLIASKENNFHCFGKNSDESDPIQFQLRSKYTLARPPIVNKVSRPITRRDPPLLPVDDEDYYKNVRRESRKKVLNMSDATSEMRRSFVPPKRPIKIEAPNPIWIKENSKVYAEESQTDSCFDEAEVSIIRGASFESSEASERPTRRFS